MKSEDDEITEPLLTNKLADIGVGVLSAHITQSLGGVAIRPLRTEVTRLNISRIVMTTSSYGPV